MHYTKNKNGTFFQMQHSWKDKRIKWIPWYTKSVKRENKMSSSKFS